MLLKSMKFGALAAVGALLLGGFFFGGDLFSYAKSGHEQIKRTVKDSVPIEFELQRARDLVEDIIPELQANIRLIAQEEVEVVALKKDIEQSEGRMKDEAKRVAALRNHMEIQKASYTFNERAFSRDQVKEELARKFERFKESETLLEGKRRLLAAREKSLQAAMQMLDKTRAKKAQLDQRIEGLTAQYRLVQAASAGSKISLDNSKLAQSDKLIKDIKKRLDVAERVLAHESQFVSEIPVDVVDEKDLLDEVDAYFRGPVTPSAAPGDSGDILTLENASRQRPDARRVK